MAHENDYFMSKQLVHRLPPGPVDAVVQSPGTPELSSASGSSSSNDEVSPFLLSSPEVEPAADGIPKSIDFPSLYRQSSSDSDHEITFKLGHPVQILAVPASPTARDIRRRRKLRKPRPNLPRISDSCLNSPLDLTSPSPPSPASETSQTPLLGAFPRISAASLSRRATALGLSRRSWKGRRPSLPSIPSALAVPPNTPCFDQAATLVSRSKSVLSFRPRRQRSARIQPPLVECPESPEVPQKKHEFSRARSLRAISFRSPTEVKIVREFLGLYS